MKIGLAMIALTHSLSLSPDIQLCIYRSTIVFFDTVNLVHAIFIHSFSKTLNGASLSYIHLLLSSNKTFMALKSMTLSNE